MDVLAAALLIPVQRKVLRRHMEQEIAGREKFVEGRVYGVCKS